MLPLNFLLYRKKPEASTDIRSITVTGTTTAATGKLSLAIGAIK